MGADFSMQQNKNFAKEVIQLPRYLLDDAIDWIQACLEPDDVFTDDQLREWSEKKGFVERD